MGNPLAYITLLYIGAMTPKQKTTTNQTTTKKKNSVKAKKKNYIGIK